MRKLLVVIAATALLSASITEYVVKKATAEVDQVEGLYLFFNAAPVSDTEYLGTVKVGMTWDSKTTTRRDAIIKKVKKEYPEAEGIVFKAWDFESAEAIRFK